MVPEPCGPAVKGPIVMTNQQGKAKDLVYQNLGRPDYLRAEKCVLSIVFK